MVHSGFTCRLEMVRKVLLLAVVISYCVLSRVSAERNVEKVNRVANVRTKDAAESSQRNLDIYFLSDDEDFPTHTGASGKSQASAPKLDLVERRAPVIKRARRNSDGDDGDGFEGSGDPSEENPSPPANLPTVVLPEENKPATLPAVVPPQWNRPANTTLAANPTTTTEFDSETETEYPEEDPYDDLPEFDDDKYAPTNV